MVVARNSRSKWHTHVSQSATNGHEGHFLGILGVWDLWPQAGRSGEVTRSGTVLGATKQKFPVSEHSQTKQRGFIGNNEDLQVW